MIFVLPLLVVLTFLSNNFSVDRTNYVNLFVKISNQPWDFLDSNGILIVFFGSIFKSLKPNLVYFLYSISSIFVLVYYSSKLIEKNSVSLLGRIYLIFFILPLYTVQLKAGLAVGLFYASIYYLESRIVKYLPVISHYSSIVLIWIRLKKIKISKLFAILLILSPVLIFTILLNSTISLDFTIFDSNIFITKIIAYQTIYQSFEKAEYYTFLNFKIILSGYLLLLSVLLSSNNNLVKISRMTTLFGIIAYYIFNFFPIMAHRISELFFVLIPFSLTLKKLETLERLLYNLSVIGTIILGLKYAVIDSTLWN